MDKIRSSVVTMNKEYKMNFTFMSILTIIGRIVRIVSRIILGAIIFIIIAHFVPELRQQIPSFYKIVDFVLSTFESFCSWLTTSIKI